MRNAATAAATLALGVVLAGCGHASSRPAVDPDLAGKPTWGGCTESSTGIIDYTAGAPGEPTAGAALAAYRVDGDHVVVVPARAHMNRRWLLVDDANRIHASLELMHTRHGWLVSTVEQCAA
jgi:hypothetical protein